MISPYGMIAQTPWQDIDFKYERELIKKALDILDDESQGVIVQQQVELYRHFHPQETHTLNQSFQSITVTDQVLTHPLFKQMAMLK